jgi:hypothetical protein
MGVLALLADVVAVVQACLLAPLQLYSVACADQRAEKRKSQARTSCRRVDPSLLQHLGQTRIQASLA